MTKNIIIHTIKDIQIGLTTQNHDHVILFNNFNVIKTIVNKPIKPIPELEETFVSLI
jgi:hypothetical protein